MKKGFTLVEMISMIIIIAVISVLSFSSMTKTVKNSQVKEVQAFIDQIENACSIYVEAFINEHPQFNLCNHKYIFLDELIDQKFLKSDINNTTTCSNDKIAVYVFHEGETFTYKLMCCENKSIIQSDDCPPENNYCTEIKAQ